MTLNDRIPLTMREEVKRMFKRVEGVKNPNTAILRRLLEIQDKYVYKGLNHMNCLSCLLTTMKNYRQLIDLWEK